MPQLAPVVLALLALLGSQDQPPATPLDIVSALETTLADAIARAEPSVVAIARNKDGKSEETTAVRGRKTAPQPVPDTLTQFRALRGLEDLDSHDYLSTDYGSGVVIGEKGEILTTFHVVKGASLLLV